MAMDGRPNDVGTINMSFLLSDEFFTALVEADPDKAEMLRREARERAVEAGCLELYNRCEAAFLSQQNVSIDLCDKQRVVLRTVESTREGKADWLIPGYVPRGEISLLVGDGGVGKTTLWCEIAAAISSGRPTFLEEICHGSNPFLKREPGLVIYFSSEDSTEKHLKGQLKKMGADMKRIKYIDPSDDCFPCIKFNSSELREIVKKERPVLVIFDPLQSFVPRGVNMGYRNQMRDCLNPLIGLGNEYDSTFIIVLHTNKRQNVSGRSRCSDSSDLWDIARSVLIAGKDRSGDGLQWYLSHEKCNYGPLQETILYTLDGGRINPVGSTYRKDADFVSFPGKGRDCSGMRTQAKDFIINLVEDGPVKMSEMEQSMIAAGFSKTAIRRGKATLREEKRIRIWSEGYGPSKTFYLGLSEELSDG